MLAMLTGSRDARRQHPGLEVLVIGLEQVSGVLHNLADELGLRVEEDEVAVAAVLADLAEGGERELGRGGVDAEDGAREVVLVVVLDLLDEVAHDEQHAEEEERAEDLEHGAEYVAPEEDQVLPEEDGHLARQVRYSDGSVVHCSG